MLYKSDHHTSRGFLIGMLTTLCNMPTGRKCKINRDFMEDLNCSNCLWIVLTDERHLPIGRPLKCECVRWCLHNWYGAVCENKFYTVSLHPHIRVTECIVLYKMWNVLNALRVLGNSWCNQKVTIFCDKAVVDVIEGNKTGDSELGVVLRELLMLRARMVEENAIPQQMLSHGSIWINVWNMSLTC